MKLRPGAPSKTDASNTPLDDPSPSSSSISSLLSSSGVDKALAFAFGIPFLLILLLVAVFDRNSTPLGILTYRVILAFAAAGIGAVIPGMIDVNVQPVIRAGGAIA